MLSDMSSHIGATNALRSTALTELTLYCHTGKIQCFDIAGVVILKFAHVAGANLPCNAAGVRSWLRDRAKFCAANYVGMSGVVNGISCEV